SENHQGPGLHPGAWQEALHSDCAPVERPPPSTDSVLGARHATFRFCLTRAFRPCTCQSNRKGPEPQFDPQQCLHCLQEGSFFPGLAREPGQRSRTEEEMAMTHLTRRSILRGTAALAASGTFARPHIAKAAATTATVWFAQGFVQDEDVALRKAVADYEK